MFPYRGRLHLYLFESLRLVYELDTVDGTSLDFPVFSMFLLSGRPMTNF